MKKVQFKSSYSQYLFLAPQLGILLIFLYWPIIQTFKDAFTMQDAFGFGTEFVWFDNFLFIDNVFLNFDNFLFYSPFTRFWQFSIGVICMLLNQIRSYSVTVSEKYIPLFSIGFLYFLSQFSLTSGRIFSSALITLIFTVILYVEISFKKVNFCVGSIKCTCNDFWPNWVR